MQKKEGNREREKACPPGPGRANHPQCLSAYFQTSVPEWRTVQSLNAKTQIRDPYTPFRPVGGGRLGGRHHRYLDRYGRRTAIFRSPILSNRRRKFTGTVTGPQGDPLPLIDCKMDGDKISFAVKVDMGGNITTFSAKGPSKATKSH